MTSTRTVAGRTFTRTDGDAWRYTLGPWTWDISRRDDQGTENGWYVRGNGISVVVGARCETFKDALAYAGSVINDFVDARALEVTAAIHDEDCAGIGRPCCSSDPRMATGRGESADRPPAGDRRSSLSVDGSVADAPDEGVEEGPGNWVADAIDETAAVADRVSDLCADLHDVIDDSFSSTATLGAVGMTKLIGDALAVQGAELILRALTTEHRVAVDEVRRRYAATDMSMVDAYRSVADDIAHGRWVPGGDG